jgi:hypothetical protein
MLCKTELLTLDLQTRTRDVISVVNRGMLGHT